MKERLKYYLRGLGTGIIVTMILMMVSNANAAQETVSEYKDDIVEEQTTELAYKDEIATLEETIEESVPVIERESMEVMPEVVETAEVESMDVEPETTQAVEEPVVTPTVDESSTVADESKEPEEVKEQPKEDTVGQQTVDAAVTIQIVKGDGSGTVARKLQNAGLIDNASEFDAYLMQHGYDKKIRIGTVKIEAGSTWMEIAEKLAGK